MQERDVPKPTGKVSAVQLFGMLIPWRPDETLVIHVNGSDKTFIPLFHQMEDLHAAMAGIGITNYQVKSIDSPRPFVEGLKAVSDPLLRIMIDLRVGEGGKVVYSEIDPHNPMFVCEGN